jgi:SAM-dependent methyltransferase
VNTWFLAREGFDTTAIDLSPFGVEATCQMLAKDRLHATVRIEGGDKIADPAATYDLVICVGVLESVGNATARRIVEEAHRVLKPGGRGFFLFAGDADFRVGPATPYDLHGFSKGEVEAVFDPFGAVDIDSYVTTYQGNKIKQFDWLVTTVR